MTASIGVASGFRRHRPTGLPGSGPITEMSSPGKLAVGWRGIDFSRSNQHDRAFLADAGSYLFVSL
jgi:hypothetical protein